MCCWYNSRPTGPIQDSGEEDLPDEALVVRVAAALLRLRYGARRASRGRARRREILRFGAFFVQEFGRPMTQFCGATPLPTGAAPRQSAPVTGGSPACSGPARGLSEPRRPPRQCRLDIARVMAAVGRESFVNRPPHVEGQWVVLPFHFTGRFKFADFPRGDGPLRLGSLLQSFRS
jgi:hypothetical protein